MASLGIRRGARIWGEISNRCRAGNVYSEDGLLVGDKVRLEIIVCVLLR